MRRAFVRLLGITPRRYRELAGAIARDPRVPVDAPPLKPVD